MIKTTTRLALATSLCMLVGCGDSGTDPTTTGGGETSDGEQTTGSAGTSTSAGSSSSSAGSSSSDASGSDSEAGTTGEPPDPEEIETCLEQVDEGDACGECGCNNCLPQLQACEDDQGCVEIRDCARENMCTGLECLDVCGDVIDSHGGLAGESAMLALVVSDCIDKQCPGLCS